jgi:hypothetical protein
VPLKTETNKSPEDILIPRTPAKEVYDFIVKEMEEAEALVPAAATVGFGGRVSKSAVRGVLARVCLFMAGHPINEHAKMAEARNWAKMVMDYTTEGGFRHELNPSFSQVFINYAQDLYDIKESIWEIEFWGYPDGLTPSPNALAVTTASGRTMLQTF